MKRSCRFTVCTLLLLASGCYAYVPVEIDEARVNDKVRARISAQQARALDPVLMRDASVLEGTVIETTPDLLLEVTVASSFRGTAVQTLSQRVRVPAAEVAFMELRSIDRTRTSLLIGSGIAATAGLVIHLLTREAGGDTRTNPPPPDESRAPARAGLRWTIP